MWRRQCGIKPNGPRRGIVADVAERGGEVWIARAASMGTLHHRWCCIQHTRPGRLEHHAHIQFHRAHLWWNKTSTFHFNDSCSEYVPRPSTAKSRIASQLTPFRSILSTNSYSKFFGRIFVCFFAYMPLNNVAILYKDSPCISRIKHPVFASSS